MSTSQPPPTPAAAPPPLLEEQMTFTYARADIAERNCIVRGVHDIILQAKAKCDGEPGPHGTRSYVMNSMSGPDFTMLVVHSYLLGEPPEKQQPSWETWLFTSPLPFTSKQLTCASVMLDAMSGTIQAAMRANPGYEAQDDITVEPQPRRLSGGVDGI